MSIELTTQHYHLSPQTPLEPILSAVRALQPDSSANACRIASRNLVSILAHHHSKIYDICNELLGKIDEECSPIAVIGSIDLFEAFPVHLGGLTSYAVSQVYRVVKKSHDRHLMVYLLATVTKNASKSDIDDKMVGKLMKLAQKNVASTTSNSDKSETSVLAQRNYLLLMKNLVLLGATSHYESLVGASAASKSKPDSLMASQHHYQTSVMTSIEKTLLLGLTCESREVRVAAVETLAHIAAGLVPTGKFDWPQYMLGLYPKEGEEDEDLVATKYLQASITESIILFLQLGQLQNPEYLASNAEKILDTLLISLDSVERRKTIAYFEKVAEFVVNEAGTNAHTILAAYVRARLNESTSATLTTKKKRESIWFKGKTKMRDVAINPKENPAQAAVLLRTAEVLIENGVKWEVKKDRAGDDNDELVKEDEKNDTLHYSSFLQSLFQLVISDKDDIRTYAIRTILIYAAHTEVEINVLISSAFKYVSQEYKSGSASLRLMSYSLLLSGLIRQTSYNLLQNSTLVKISSFCTQNLKHNGDSLRASSCWLILSSLVSFHNESEFVRLNSSQLLVFWKSLLTSQYLQSKEDEKEILNNLHVRNFALVCLLSYIETVTFSPETLKQVQFLLTKSYNYITYLESNISGIAGVTDLGQGFIDADYSVDRLSNVLFARATYSGEIPPNQYMVALVLNAKKILLECFVHLGAANKHDINSSMVIFVVKLFSDGRLLSDEDTPDLSDLIHNCVSPTYDPLSLVTNLKPTPIITSLVDLSIALFQTVFPFLSAQIQFSLLEQIRGCLASANGKRVHHNVAAALKGMLENAKTHGLEVETSRAILDVLAKVSAHSEEVVSLVAGSTGLVHHLLDTSEAAATEASLVRSIVTDEDPYTRGRAVLELAYIFSTTHHGFEGTFDVAMQLAADPHPVVHYYALKALVVLMEANPDCVAYVDRVVERLFESFEGNDYGYDIDNKTMVNLRVIYGKKVAVDLLSVCVGVIGPSIKDLDDGQVQGRPSISSRASEPTEIRQKLFALIIGYANGCGFATADDYTSFKSLLLLLQEVVIFDRTLVSPEYMARLLDFVIQSNMKLGIGVASPTTTSGNALFPFCTSDALYNLAFDNYVELVQLCGTSVLSPETQIMLWVAMQVKPCASLKRLISLWVESTMDASWFATLHTLFKSSARRLTSSFISKHFSRKLLPLAQREKKTTEVVLHDEEAEGIVTEEDTSEKAEAITWEFKSLVFSLLEDILSAAKDRKDIASGLEKNIADIVKICFLGSTSSIAALRLQGVALLDGVLVVFGDRPDPLWEETEKSEEAPSILEQEQAQIISALMPCFSSSSDVNILVKTIHVCSTFINLPRIKFYSKQRILRTLIFLLEEISSGKFLRFGYLDNMSEHGRKSIQLAILNCWALLRIDAANGAEPELQEVLAKYQNLLTSLWILVLREFSSLKVTGDRELGLYANYWINFISVLTIELAEQPSISDPQFFFVLFSQCVESLIRNKNVGEVLMSMARLVQNTDLVKMLMHQDIFGELIDLLDRIALIEKGEEIKGVITVVSKMVEAVTRAKGNDAGVAKDGDLAQLYELLRVCMLPLFRILPFLRADYDPSNESYKLTLKKADSPTNVSIVGYNLKQLLEVSAMFPASAQNDLHACLLFVFAKIYEYGNDTLVKLALPHVKTLALIADSKLIATFFAAVRKHYDIANSVPTTIVLITCGDVVLGDNEARALANALLAMVETEPDLAIQCVRSLFQHGQKKPIAVVKYVVEHLFHELNDGSKNPKLAFEMLFLFTKGVVDEDKLSALYAVLVPLLVRYEGEIEDHYIQERLLLLVKQSSKGFKNVVFGLSEEERGRIERLLRIGESGGQEEEEIELKVFE